MGFYRRKSSKYEKANTDYGISSDPDKGDACVQSTHPAMAAFLLHVLQCCTWACQSLEWKQHFHSIAHINTVT